ncbi:phenazine biosynthesis-like protein [Powellomyces hirtus]|nr:phenazine biosynthesis-like protein [Powellomyces hirtus]
MTAAYATAATAAAADSPSASSPFSGLAYDTVDVFTTTRFGGNPLAIVHIPHPPVSPAAGTTNVLTQSNKQTLAREFNYSETVFLHYGTDSTYTLDIFTTDFELPLAGHPVIGTTWAIANANPAFTSGTLKTKAGPVAVRAERDEETGTIRVAASLPHAVRAWDGPGLSFQGLLALQPGLKGAAAALSEKSFPYVSLVEGMTFVLVALPSTDVLNGMISPAAQRVACPSFIPSSTFVAMYFYVPPTETDLKARKNIAVHTRMIDGNLEDPATGSAASCLSAYLAMQAGTASREDANDEDSRYEFALVQGEMMGRRSEIFVDVTLSACSAGGGETPSVRQIELKGSAVHVMRGMLV